MIQALCLQKFRNKNNQIIGYRLQDRNGNTLDVKSEYLKQAIKNKQINILNLTLTSDNKLIDKEYKSQKVQKVQKTQKNNLKNIIAKISVLGTPFTSFCGHTYYVIENSDTTIVYIPDDVKYLIEPGDVVGSIPDFNNINCKTLKVIGGSGLASTHNMFWFCKAQSIDLSSFDTSKVTKMGGMFMECEAQSLDLSSFDTSKVTSMGSMFRECQAKSIELSSFDTSNVTDMWSMFDSCQAQSLDLSSFDTSNVTYMQCMFSYCKAQSLDLSSFDTSNVTDMTEMFSHCKAQVEATDRKIIEALHKR